MTEDKKLSIDEYLYENCLIDAGLKLKKRGFDNYQKIAADMCRIRVDEGTFDARSFASEGTKKEIQRSFALEIGDLDTKDDCYEFPVYAITSGMHDADGDQKVYIEPNTLHNNIEAFNELPVYYNHQRTPDDLLGIAVNPEYVELDDGLKAVKLLARIHKDAAKANEVLEKIENGDMTHVSIDWLSNDLDVMGESFATDIRPIEVSFIDNETRTPVCDACTIGKKCDEHEMKTDCGCGSDHDKACTCETNGSTSEEITMAEETVKETEKTNPIVEREFASMKSTISEMESAQAELNTKYEDALATITKFEEAEETRNVTLAKARVSSFIDSIINKETLLGKVNDESVEARTTELSAWDEIKLEGFSIAMESMPVPEETERTFGKGKAHDVEEKPVGESDETHRMFAMEDGKIVFKGLETEEKGD
jgi:hypothetical protein